MPKMVSELAQGNQFSRSGGIGGAADTATRSWRVILNTPGEQWDIFQAIGVAIGDEYSTANPIPCVSIEMRADGESRLVRIVTAQYQSTVGSDGGSDPGTVSPDLRPANFSMSTTLYEMPAWNWKRLKNGSFVSELAANPVGDMFDGVTKLEPITTIRVTQFEATPGTDKMQYCGYVNDATLPLGNLASFPKHTVMFRGVEATPHVESFGNLVVRGFMNTYEFAYRINKIDAPGATGEYGWGMAIPVTGFNCKAFNPQQANLEKDAYGQPLKFQGSRLVEPLALPEKVTAGDKVRAMVKIGDPDSGAVSQNPSAQPIPLCEDGEPRAATAQPKVLIWRVLTQPEGNLASLLQLRLQ